MFNDLETIIFCYFLDTNDWNYKQLSEDSNDTPNFLNNMEVV